MVAFHYFLKQKNRFSFDTVMLTATITIAFVGRNTSIVGWIPLLAIKVLMEGSLLPFLMSAVLVAIPLMGLSVAIDSAYYGGSEWTFTSINFLKVNILENLSKYFGTDPWYQYLFIWGFIIFLAVYPFVLYANSFGHIKIAWSKGQTPYLTYYNLFYFIVFSLIPHKEMRFLLPILPFALLLTGEFYAQTLKNHPVILRLSLFLNWFLTIGFTSFQYLFHHRSWEIPAYLIAKGEQIHSLHTIERFSAPYYSWFHGYNTKLLPDARAPKFALLRRGDPLAIASGDKYVNCTTLIADIKEEKVLP